jgi:hypothetical protein
MVTHTLVFRLQQKHILYILIKKKRKNSHSYQLKFSNAVYLSKRLVLLE